jgi:hypothetical protein
MGLDLLDIQFRIEKEFDIAMSSEDFMSLVRDRDITVGDLYSLLLTKLHLRDVARNDFGLNYRLWEEMQGVVQSVTAVPREQIELKTPLEALFPSEGRRATWDALRSACPYHIRELDYPKAVRAVGFSLAIGMVLVEQFHIWQLAGEMALAGIGIARDMDGQRDLPESPVDLRAPAEALSLRDEDGQGPLPDGSGDELQGHLQWH